MNHPRVRRRFLVAALMLVPGGLVTGRGHAGEPWDPIFASQSPDTQASSCTRSSTVPFEPPPVIFEGFGLGDFQGAGSLAVALDHCDASPGSTETMFEFKGIDIRGPGGRDASPAAMAAELQSRIDWIDVAAGVSADPERLSDGPSRWTGRFGLKQARESGSESLEVRTMVAPSDVASMVGVAVGPKIERKLRRGLTVFIDGQAEAQAYRPADAGWWSLPGVADGSLATLGVTARTGIMR